MKTWRWLLLSLWLVGTYGCQEKPAPGLVKPDYSQMSDEECLSYAEEQGAVTVAKFNAIVRETLQIGSPDSEAPADSLQPMTSTGFSSQYKLDQIPSKLIWIKDPSSGFATGIYLASAFIVSKKIIAEPGMLYQIGTSPKAGYDPRLDALGLDRGYTAMISAGSWNMSTILYFLERRLNGESIQRHYPISPKLLEWNYLQAPLQ